MYILYHTIWVNHNDLTVLAGIMASQGNHPQMTQQFRLVNYYYLLDIYNLHIHNSTTILSLISCYS